MIKGTPMVLVGFCRVHEGLNMEVYRSLRVQIPNYWGLKSKKPY